MGKSDGSLRYAISVVIGRNVITRQFHRRSIPVFHHKPSKDCGDKRINEKAGVDHRIDAHVYFVRHRWIQDIYTRLSAVTGHSRLCVDIPFRWQLEGAGKETLLLLSLPSQDHGQIILEESIGSGSMDFNLLKEYDNRIGVWSGKPDTNGEYISYKASILLQHKDTAFRQHLRGRHTLTA